jgi:catechol 2,3-dioxygenase-like lactoylglutathione lyase family enzyme
MDFHHITLRITDLDRSRAYYRGRPWQAIDQDVPNERLRFHLDGTMTGAVLAPWLAHGTVPLKGQNPCRLGNR